MKEKGDRVFIKNENQLMYQEDDKTLGIIEFEFVSSKVVNIIHTYVEPSVRGKGIASKLVEYAVNYFSKDQIKVIASCSYAEKWIQEHQN